MNDEESSAMTEGMREAVSPLEHILKQIESVTEQNPKGDLVLRWRETGRGVRKQTFACEPQVPYPVSLANEIRYAAIEVAAGACLSKRIVFTVVDANGVDATRFALSVQPDGQYRAWSDTPPAGPPAG